MKRLLFTLIVACILLWSTQSSYGQASNQQDPVSFGASQNMYNCPNHPEVTATWSAKCPKCGATMVRRQQQRRAQSISTRSAAEEMRRRIMINTSISVFDPEAILCARRPLGLTSQEITKLQAISLEAREGAKNVLTEKQRNELTRLDSLSNYPKTMSEMHRRILQGLPASNAMMLDTLMHQMRSRNFASTSSEPPSQSSDPSPSGKTNVQNASLDSFQQSTLNSLSARNRGTINNYSQMLENDPFQQSTLNSLSARNRGGIDTYSQMLENDPFQQSTLDSLRDKYRDQYRDRLRDNYRDQLRDSYRDYYRDRFRDSFGGMGGFGGGEFGGEGEFGRGFDNGGFGNNELGGQGEFRRGFDNGGFGNNESSVEGPTAGETGR